MEKEKSGAVAINTADALWCRFFSGRMKEGGEMKLIKADNSQQSKKRLQVAEMLANPSFSGTNKDIYEAVGISHDTFYKWLRDDDFLAEVEKLIGQYTNGELAKVWKALLRQCEKGDTQAIKLFFELKGKYKTSVELTAKTGISTLEAICSQLDGD